MYRFEGETRGRGGRGSGFRGGRGMRRGGRGGPGMGGDYRGKREFDRQSGMVTSGVKAEQMDNLMGVLVRKGRYTVQNIWNRELYGMKMVNGLDILKNVHSSSIAKWVKDLKT